MAKNDSKAMLEAKIALLTKARNYIKRGNEYAICSALCNAEYYFEHLNKKYNPLVMTKATYSLVRYISSSLGYNSYYSGWLARELGCKWSCMVASEQQRAAKQGRLAWIDWMIKCLEEDLGNLKPCYTPDSKYALAA